MPDPASATKVARRGMIKSDLYGDIKNVAEMPTSFSQKNATNYERS